MSRCGDAVQSATRPNIDVRDNGHIWLQYDGTDLNIADTLMGRSIPKDSIVIGFQPPCVRPLMDGFAVA